MKVVPLRLQPGDDLRAALQAWVGEQETKAGCGIRVDQQLGLPGRKLGLRGQAIAAMVIFLLCRQMGSRRCRRSRQLWPKLGATMGARRAHAFLMALQARATQPPSTTSWVS